MNNDWPYVGQNTREPEEPYFLDSDGVYRTGSAHGKGAAVDIDASIYTTETFAKLAESVEVSTETLEAMHRKWSALPEYEGPITLVPNRADRRTQSRAARRKGNNR